MIKKIRNANIVVLPIPISRDKKNLNLPSSNSVEIKSILQLLDTSNIIFGGQFFDSAKKYLKENDIKYIDYFDIESFQIQNALLSAEGAIFYSKEKLERTISGLRVAILGFGRIAKILSYLLRSQGATITVYARKESDFTWCKLIGLNAVKIRILGNRSSIDFQNNNYDLIFNTIPYQILDERFAKNYDGATLLIDLASYPFGIDDSIAKKYNLNYYRELGIPGRYAPKSAGNIIGETILNNLQFEEE